MKAFNLQDAIKILINGGVTTIPDEHKKDVQKALREIKNNCTIVLSQLKNN